MMWQAAPSCATFNTFFFFFFFLIQLPSARGVCVRMVVQEAFGVGWARRRKLRDGFCGERLKADASWPACPAGSGAGSDSANIWTSGSNREDGCGEPESAGRKDENTVSSDPLIYVGGVTSPAGAIPKPALLGASAGLRYCRVPGRRFCHSR